MAVVGDPGAPGRHGLSARPAAGLGSARDGDVLASRPAEVG